MIGTIERCWLFAYQTSLQDAQALLPKGFEAVNFADFGFYNIVVSKIKAMRPNHFPEAFGVTYWHVAYRLYARIHPKKQAPIEGLFFLRSECSDLPITAAGEMMTDFNFHYAMIKVQDIDASTIIDIRAADEFANAVIDRSVEPQLPSHSAFTSIEQAQSFLKYKANGLSAAGPGKANVVTITRVEDQWRSQIVNVASAEWSFMKDRNVLPEICYEVEPIFYRWNAGIIMDIADG